MGAPPASATDSSHVHVTPLFRNADSALLVLGFARVSDLKQTRQFCAQEPAWHIPCGSQGLLAEADVHDA